jgi:hypothetical protein
MSAEIVAQVKAELEAAGVSLVGPCGAYDITRRVAWRLREDGAGLLDKPDGNNCDGYAVDIIAYRDGRIFDCLGKSGGEEDQAGHPIPGTGNVPIWMAATPMGNEAARWRAPHDPDADPAPPAHIPPPTMPYADPVWDLRVKMEALFLQSFQKMDALEAHLAKAVKDALAEILPTTLAFRTTERVQAEAERVKTATRRQRGPKAST